MAIIDLPTSPFLLDTDLNQFVGIKNPDDSVISLTSSSESVTQYSCVLTIDSDVPVPFANAAQKLNLVTIFSPTTDAPGVITGGGDFEFSVEGTYNIECYLRVVGFNAGGGWSATNLNFWGSGDAGVQSQSEQSYLEVAMVDENLYNASVKYQINVSEGSVLSFYILATTLNAKLDYVQVFESGSFLKAYPLKVVLTRIK